MIHIRKHKTWTSLEIARLKRFWPVMPRQRLEAEFAPRSWGSIRVMAYTLGIKRPRGLGAYRNWKAIAAEHKPVFNLPTDVPVQIRRPWS